MRVAGANPIAKAGAPSLPLPRKRERGPGFCMSTSLPQSIAIDRCVNLSLSTLRSALPLPLAGEGWGGGLKMNHEQKPSWRVTSKQRNRARALRKNLTDAERAMWAMLRGHRLNGLRFRRQFPIGPFIADFVCLTARLVIEIDGGQHFSDDAEMRDARRTVLIESKGFRILRFSNHDVLTNRSGVLETIAAAAEASAPSPTLPRKRERETDASGKTS